MRSSSSTGVSNPGGATKHEKFTDGEITIRIKRRREIEDEIFEKLRKQAGLE